METTLNWFTTLNLIGAAYGFLLSVVIWQTGKIHKTTSRLLSLLIFVLTMTVMAAVMWATHIYAAIPHLFGIFPQFYFLIGPFLYLYIKSLTVPGFTFKKQYLFHFMPFIIVILNSVDFYLLDAATKLERYNNMLVFPEQGNVSFREVFICIQLTVYIILSWKLLWDHMQSIKNSFSEIKRIRLIWLRYLIFAVIALLVFYIIFTIFRFQGGMLFHQFGRIGISTAETFIILFLSYKGLINPDIFVENKYFLKEKKKYSSSLLTKREAKKFLSHLIDYMETNKPYLNPDLSINDLSSKTAIPARYLSQIINEQLGQNFFDFINQYRVNEAKKLLTDPQKQNTTILMIAYDAGFNSKSTFNIAFKKYTNQTPSQFRKLSTTIKKKSIINYLPVP